MIFKKVIQIYKEFGVKGLAQRVISVFKELIDFNVFRVSQYLKKKSGLYRNYLRLMNDIRSTHQVQDMIIAKGLRSINKLMVQSYKKSDRIFILGSGSSVNDLTLADWEHISLSDSIGFNFWMVHDFIPTFYFVEPVGSDELWKIFLQLFELRKTSYSKTPFVCDYKLWQSYEESNPLSEIPREIAKNMHFYAPYYIRLNSKKLISLALCYWSLFKINQTKLEDLINHRATLSALIMFSVFAGYKEIVLVGVDLNNTAYFWEANSLKQYKIKPANAQTGKIHRSADPDIDINQLSIPIDQYIDLLDQIILKPRGISLFIASEKSRLYPRLKKYIFPSQ